MRTAFKYLCAVVVIALAIYGAFSLAAGFLTESHGKQLGKAMQPFVYGLVTTVADRFKKTLAETPDEILQKESEAISRKLYPILKGALLGFVDGYLKDPDRDEVGRKLREVGRAVSEQMIAPFAEGLAEGSGKVVGKLDSTAEEIRKFNEKHRDVIDSVASALKALKALMDKMPPPVPQGSGPTPGLPPP
jgi:hypothetical protein